MPSVLRYSTIAVSIITFGLVIAQAASFIRHSGVCCADDAYFAIVAKSIAVDGKYGLPVASDRTVGFHPEIGSGPALIFPGALMIAAFGSKVWVPGATTLLIVVVQVGLLVLVLRQRVRLANALLFASMTLAGLLALGNHQWYLGIYAGEVPAIGFLLLGACLLVSNRLFAAGACLGLAFLTKQITLLASAGMVVGWASAALLTGRNGKQIRDGSKILFGFLLLLGLFELYKLHALGPAQYVANFVEVVGTTSRMAVGSAIPASERPQRMLEILSSPYSIGFGALASVLLASVLCAFAAKRGCEGGRDAATLLVVFGFGLLLYVFYFAAVSVMWPRYLYVGVGLLAAALATPLLLDNARLVAVYLLVLLAFAVTPAAVLRNVYQFSNTEHRATDLKDVASFLDSTENRSLPIASRSWQSFFDTLFLLQTPRTWVLGKESEVFAGRPHLVVLNRRFADAEDEIVKAWLASCAPKFSQGSYLVLGCGSVAK